MELASRVFDVVTNPINVTDQIKKSIPEIADKDQLSIWRRTLRMAALCHDLGHLPFSHGAEKELLPKGWDHEKMTAKIIHNDELNSIWEKQRPKLDATDIAKLAIGEAKMKAYGETVSFSKWETLLSEIITGDAFGVDRIDYLLRDSLHAGVAYGKFDHFRLIDTLRILPIKNLETEDIEPKLGMEEGGLHSAEALLLARYFMFTQLYFHHVRRIYDYHLKQFLQKWLPGGMFSTDLNEHLKISDSNIIAEIRKAAIDANHPAYKYAKRICSREHFRMVYHRNYADYKINPTIAVNLFEGIIKNFDENLVYFDSYQEEKPSEGPLNFPVSKEDVGTVWSITESDVIEKIPGVVVDFIFVDLSIQKKIKDWINIKRYDMLGQSLGGAKK